MVNFKDNSAGFQSDVQDQRDNGIGGIEGVEIDDERWTTFRV